MRITPRMEIVYSKYPRKRGKSSGMKRMLAQCKTEEDLVLLERAIANYVEDIKKTGVTDIRFVKLFSTFMGEWRDWIDPEPNTLEGLDADLTGINFD